MSNTPRQAYDAAIRAVTTPGLHPAVVALIRRRLALGLSQRQVARSMLTSQSVVSKIENGACSPSLDTLTRYAAAVGLALTVAELPAVAS